MTLLPFMSHDIRNDAHERSQSIAVDRMVSRHSTVHDFGALGHEGKQPRL